MADRRPPKRRIVLSGVGISAMGVLMTFRDAIESLAAEYSGRFDIIALVHNKSLFNIPGVTFLEYPEVKASKLRRLRFEYWDCRKISKRLNAYLWLAMHDITPSVQAEVKAVYCQNAVACYGFRWKEAVANPKFGLFMLFYQFLYGINIAANDFVVVQQDGLRRAFVSRYGISNVVVAHPSVDKQIVPEFTKPRLPSSSYRFFYPSYPWTHYKNFEQILNAARRLERSGFHGFEIWLTMDGTETPYAAKMAREYADLATVRWLGVLPRTEVMRLYSETDCLLFPSKLESWGMPITEFKTTGKPMLAADLPYAHETVGEYGSVAFFDPEDSTSLATMMRKAAGREAIFTQVSEQQIAAPFARNWGALWKILLAPESEEKANP
jgi:glycosyltransferase involved in cell wall biosynthesis